MLVVGSLALAEEVAEGVVALALLVLLVVLDALLSFQVVDASQILIGQDIVSFLNFAELDLALLGLALVGVVLQTHVSICFFDFTLLGVSRGSEKRTGRRNTS